MPVSAEKQIADGLRQLVDREVRNILRPGWLPCKHFGLTPRKAVRLGLRVSHVGKTPYVNVDEFNAHAERCVEAPSNDIEPIEQDDLQAAFGVAPSKAKRGAR